jgi:hypothetical protein
MQPPLLLIGIVSIGTMLIQLAAVALHHWNTRGRYMSRLRFFPFLLKQAKVVFIPKAVAEEDSLA